MVTRSPRLLVVAHGTASADGVALTRSLVAAVGAARPEVSVSLCFLDVAHPRLPEALDDLREPLVVVPLLLSTGYHVQTDIPAAVSGRPDVAVAGHLGPDPAVVDAVVDRLPALRGDETIALVATGSSRPAAADELAAAASQVAARTGRPVQPVPMTRDVGAALAALPAPVVVATYLLAPGRFLDLLREAAGTAGSPVREVADPLGVHPALVQLVWRRYDDARAAAAVR
jgi:sirohydrochlorin ferrochelatase